MLVLIGVAAAFRAAFLPHMTESSMASKLAEANLLVACPPQWLPVLLAVNIPVLPTNGRRLLDNVFTAKGDLRLALVEYDANAKGAKVKYGAPNTWDVAGITNMSELFVELENINEDISSWDTSGVTTMRYMFSVRALASNLQPSPSLQAACTTTAPTALSPPGPHLALLHVPSLRLGRPRKSSISR